MDIFLDVNEIETAIFKARTMQLEPLSTWIGARNQRKMYTKRGAVCKASRKQVASFGKILGTGESWSFRSLQHVRRRAANLKGNLLAYHRRHEHRRPRDNSAEALAIFLPKYPKLVIFWGLSPFGAPFWANRC
jgi:hypothetical protein